MGPQRSLLPACMYGCLPAYVRAHRYARFTWGDQRSLQEIPAAAGVDMRESLRHFHTRYYSSRLMTVVVLGKW